MYKLNLTNNHDVVCHYVSVCLLSPPSLIHRFLHLSLSLCDLTKISRGQWSSTHRQTRLFLSTNNFLIVSSSPHRLLGRLETGKALVTHSVLLHTVSIYRGRKYNVNIQVHQNNSEATQNKHKHFSKDRLN